MIALKTKSVIGASIDEIDAHTCNEYDLASVAKSDLI